MIMITDEERKIVIEILARILPGCTAYVFGSRYSGEASEFSDLDLAVVTEPRIDLKTRGRLRDEFGISYLRFSVDVVDYNRCARYFKDIIDAGVLGLTG